ncbi:MAG: TonB-dependent receptor [Pseudidiomarina maritima]|nr:TonB-dependent receptor [Pseudidiomarina maritima]
MKYNLLYKSVLCALLLGTSQTIAFAQENTQPEEEQEKEKKASLEVLMVTAERRSESIQDTPMSVTAFNEEMIVESGITTIEDIAQQTPNLKINTFNISEPQLYIRGIGTTNDSAGSDPGVAVFIDDVYIGRPSGTAMDLYDLERIEILRGPQGTLYGRNSAGGAINLFTKKPHAFYESKVGLSVGNEGLVNVRGYVNGAISDNVFGKITTNIRQRDGFAENVTTGQELEDEDTKSIRGQLLIEANADVEVLLGFDHTSMSGNGSNRYLTRFDTAPIFPVQAFIDLQLASNASIGNDPRKSNSALFQSTMKDLSGVQARVDANLDWARFTSITAYRESESSWVQPLVPTLSVRDGGTGLYEINNGADQQADQISQEFRLASETDTLKWVTGLFYFKENVDRDENFNTFFSPGILPPAVSIGDVNFIQDASTESVAVFGQLTWDVRDDLAITLGGRYTDDKKSIDNTAVNNLDTPVGGIPLLGPGYSVEASESWADTTYRATIDWNVTDDHLLYFTYSEGFKSGSFNGQQSSPIIAATPILPETSTNFEVGAKTEWFDNRLRLNVTYFQLDYEDLQTFQLINGTTLVADNANAEVSGLEADFALAITESLKLTGTFASLDGEFVDGSYVGNETPRSPGTSWSLSPVWSVPLATSGWLDFAINLSYTDEYFIDNSNDLRGLQDEVTLLDASIKYSPDGGKWDLTLWGKNIQDELYTVHSINGNLGGASEVYAPPRTFGLTFNYYWE